MPTPPKTNATLKSPRGRPRQGVRPGERVRDYATVTLRLPADTRALLKAVGSHLERPLWQTIRHLTVCFVRELPGRERRRVVAKARRREGAE